MHDDLGSRQHGAGRNGVTSQLKWLESHAPGRPDRGVQTHGFRENLIGQSQVRQVGQGDVSVPKHFVKFRMPASLPLWMGGQQVPGPSQGQGGGFVAGCEQGHGLIPHLPVGQDAFVWIVRLGIGRLHQQGQQIVSLPVRLTPLRDQVSHRLIQKRQLLPESAGPGQGQLMKKAPQGKNLVLAEDQVMIAALKCLTNARDLRGQIEIE